MTPLVSKAVKFSPDPESATWFDVGVIAESEEKRVPVDFLMKLPFPRTAVTGIDGSGAQFVFWLAEGENSVTVGGGSLTHQRYFEPFAYLVVDGELKAYRKEGELPTVDVKSAITMIAAILDRLSGGGTAYRPEATKSLINRARAAKGKPPALFSWTTVNVEPAQERGGHQGGTHASPRLHDRRGHWRTYPSGKRGWVKACKVGDASRGAVFHDYQIKEQA
jgi:hypothetical protein